MKFVLTLSSRGLITLPVKLRRSLGLRPNDQLIAEQTEGGIVLRPAVTLPIEICTDERIREFDEGEAEAAEAVKKLRAS